MIHYKEQGEFLCRVTSSYTDIFLLFRTKKKNSKQKVPCRREKVAREISLNCLIREFCTQIPWKLKQEVKWLEDEHFVTRRVNREIRRCLSQCRASKKMYRWTAKTNSILVTLVSDLGKFSSMESQRKWLKNGKDQLMFQLVVSAL